MYICMYMSEPHSEPHTELYREFVMSVKVASQKQEAGSSSANRAKPL